MTVEIVEGLPSPVRYAELRKSVGWYPVEEGAVVRGLEASLYSVCALDGETVVGCGRVVGDGGVYFYLQDVIVLPRYQGRGIGAALMDRLMAYLRDTARTGAFVGLMAADGVAGFYEGYGFSKRPEGGPGMFRVWSEGDAAPRLDS